MDGNCKRAQGVMGKNEMYPCFYTQVTYGMAMKGFHQETPSLRVILDVDLQEEPNVRSGAKPAELHGTVLVSNLEAGKQYVLYRYKDFRPKSHFEQGYEFKTTFTAAGETYKFEDPH